MGLFRQLGQDVLFYSKSRNFISVCGTVFFNASLQLLVLYRISHVFYDIGWRRLTTVFHWMQIVMFNCQIHSGAKIGRNFKISHPVGIIIGAAEIGDDVTVWQNVTIGSHGKQDEGNEYPTIGNNVKIFANSVVVGKIRIGDSAIIGAVSFINKDIPDGAIGLTGRIVERSCG